MRKRLINLLRLADLREEEITVYLLLLKLKESTISNLRTLCGLNTMMIYRTLKRLKERGLIKEIPLNNKQNIFRSLSLNALVSKLEREKNKIIKVANSLKNLDPLLPFVNISKDSEDEIEIREGIDAFKEEYLKFPRICEQEYLHVGSMENYWKVANMSYESPEERYFINTRIKRGIYARVMDLDNREMQEVRERDSLEKRTLKLKKNLPVMKNYLSMAESQSSLFICDEKNPRVVIIRQPELLKLHRAQFSGLWNN